MDNKCESELLKQEQRESIAKTFCGFMYEVELHELQIYEFVQNCYKFADKLLDDIPYLEDMRAAYNRSLAAKKAAHRRELNKMPYEPNAHGQMR